MAVLLYIFVNQYLLVTNRLNLNFATNKWFNF